MQEIMRIGNDFVPADKDIKDIGNTSTEIVDVAHKYKTNVLAVISKGDKHNLVTQSNEDDTQLVEDVIKIISIIETIADKYNANANDIIDIIKLIIPN